MPDEQEKKPKRARINKFNDWGEDTVQFIKRAPEEQPVEIKKEAPKDKLTEEE